MNHYIYEITNLVNGKKYIGKRSCHCPIEEDKYMGSGKRLKVAFSKYGSKNFKKEILMICESEKEAFEYEKEYIEKVKAYSNDNYYNIAGGGEGGFTNFIGKTQEELDLWKKRMSESRKGRIIARRLPKSPLL